MTIYYLKNTLNILVTCLILYENLLWRVCLGVKLWFIGYAYYNLTVYCQLLFKVIIRSYIFQVVYEDFYPSLSMNKPLIFAKLIDVIKSHVFNLSFLLIGRLNILLILGFSLFYVLMTNIFCSCFYLGYCLLKLDL